MYFILSYVTLCIVLHMILHLLISASPTKMRAITLSLFTAAPSMWRLMPGTHTYSSYHLNS